MLAQDVQTENANHLSKREHCVRQECGTAEKMVASNHAHKKILNRRQPEAQSPGTRTRDPREYLKPFSKDPQMTVTMSVEGHGTESTIECFNAKNVYTTSTNTCT